MVLLITPTRGTRIDEYRLDLATGDPIQTVFVQIVARSAKGC
jgi:hypothetical protein